MVVTESSELKEARTFPQILKHMQGLSRRTPTNFTLSAIYAVPYGNSHRSQKMNLLGELCNLPCSYVWLNVSSTSGSHIFNTWTTRALVSSLILTEYWRSMLYTKYLIYIYQMECVHGKKSFMKRLSNEETLNFFINVSTTIPLALHWYCVLMVWAVYAPWPDIARNCSLFAEGQ